MDRKQLEEKLAELPISQYEFMESSELVFSERVRNICESECPMYGRTWACPPAVGTLEQCRARCLSYPHMLVFTTLTEVGDTSDLGQTLATREAHEELTRQVAALVRQQSDDVMVLSAEACAICSQCAYPDAPCRHPDKMFPCVESHGILATDIAEKHGIEFYGGNLVTWFSIVFHR